MLDVNERLSAGSGAEASGQVAVTEGPSVPRVEVFGIRHHGPGSTRSLLAALEEFRPDAVLIEGPADADPLLRWSVAEGMQPPLALLAYACDEASVAAFWPFAVFSPEWQALTWALRRRVEVAFCDLPAALTLAQPGQANQPRACVSPARRDPLGTLAGAAGYDDAERWWDDVVESRLDGASPFPALLEAMTELRRSESPAAAAGELAEADSVAEARREAYMRQTIRTALKAGRRRVAVVCGAWHAPVLTWPLPPAAADIRTLRGAPKRKVTLTWVPWTHERLTTASGYGAGITSPGWYHHLWTAPDRPIVRWLTKVATSLRSRDLVVSSAHVIEAVRLAETLAALRNRPLAGLAEVTDATRAVLCDGDELAVRFVTDQLVVGQALGSVSEGVPTVPLDADLQARCRTLRIKREARPRLHDLDLRRDYDQERSRLFHCLRLLEIDWVLPAESDVQSRGTFRETWQSQWRPELAVALVEAALWGTTVTSAASAKVERTAADASLATLTAMVERCLLAGLPDALAVLLTALAAQAAVDSDVEHLMDALPPLARAQRYGDVRGTDTTALRQVASALVLRICEGLPQAVGGLDDSAATALRRRIDDVHGSVSLLVHADEGPTGAPALDLSARWLQTLARLVDRRDVNGQLEGRCVRLLFDAERLDDVAVRVTRALSHGVGAASKAAWVDGFFADGALLLIHDATLRDLLDEWVAGLDEREFVEVLPLVRRTFGTFAPSERRAIAGRVAAGVEPARAEEDLDLELAAAALDTVSLIFDSAAQAGATHE